MADRRQSAGTPGGVADARSPHRSAARLDRRRDGDTSSASPMPNATAVRARRRATPRQSSATGAAGRGVAAAGPQHPCQRDPGAQSASRASHFCRDFRDDLVSRRRSIATSADANGLADTSCVIRAHRCAFRPIAIAAPAASCLARDESSSPARRHRMIPNRRQFVASIAAYRSCRKPPAHNAACAARIDPVASASARRPSRSVG